MRFEERLRTHFDIEDAAMNARLPAMLLQPLIENAIKYAVGPQEEGARISLTGRVVGERLRIAVEDTGPGARNGIAPSSQPRTQTPGEPISTGVGLVNIQNRLAQGYGENHLFETRSNPGGGFTVLIEIPYEPAANTEPNTSSSSKAPSSDTGNPEQGDNVIDFNSSTRAIGAP
jgi:sensor histidine kinase YesM